MQKYSQSSRRERSRDKEVQSAVRVGGVEASPTERFSRSLRSFIEAAEKLIKDRLPQGSDLLVQMKKLPPQEMKKVLVLVDKFILLLDKDTYKPGSLEAQCMRLTVAMHQQFEKMRSGNKDTQVKQEKEEGFTLERRIDTEDEARVKNVKSMALRLGFTVLPKEALDLDRRSLYGCNLSGRPCIFLWKKSPDGGETATVVIQPTYNIKEYAADFFSSVFSEDGHEWNNNYSFQDLERILTKIAGGKKEKHKNKS